MSIGVDLEKVKGLLLLTRLFWTTGISCPDSGVCLKGSMEQGLKKGQRSKQKAELLSLVGCLHTEQHRLTRFRVKI